MLIKISPQGTKSSLLDHFQEPFMTRNGIAWGNHFPKGGDAREIRLKINSCHLEMRGVKALRSFANSQVNALRLVSYAMVSGSVECDGVSRTDKNGHLRGQPALHCY